MVVWDGLLIFSLVAVGTDAAKIEFDRGDGVAIGEFPSAVASGGRGHFDIGNTATLAANEVPVLLQVGAVAGRFTVDVDLFDQATFDEGFQTIVNRGQGDGRHLLLDPDENLGGSGVVSLFEQDVENLPPLRSEAQAAVADGGLVVLQIIGFHVDNKANCFSLSRIIPNKI
jgi:hypothetical protein